jgi:hypothetical protein
MSIPNMLAQAERNNKMVVNGQKSACTQTLNQESELDTWLQELLKSKGADDLYGLISAAVKKEVSKISDNIKKTVAEECG